MMTLKEWLEAKGMNVVDFADAIGLDHTGVYRAIAGDRLPSLESAFAIEHFTRGRVKAESFLRMIAGRVHRDSGVAKRARASTANAEPEPSLFSGESVKLRRAEKRGGRPKQPDGRDLFGHKKPDWNQEARPQAAIVEYVRWVAPQIVIFHVPNGGWRSKAEAARFKWIGVLAGVFDLVLILPDGRSAYWEAKRPKGRPVERRPEEVSGRSRSARPHPRRGPLH